MGSCHDRVLAALELREPDRVPTMDVLEEISNVYEVLEKKPLPFGFLFSNPHAGRVINRLAPLINRSHLFDREMDRFSHDRTQASVKLGYDASWVMHVPIWRFQDTKTIVDVYGRRYDTSIDEKGNLATPMYRGGLITSPQDWDDWDKSDLFRMPERANRAFTRIQKDFGDQVFIFGAFLYGLFENSWQPMGFERFAVAVRREKAFIRRMIKFYEDHFCMMLQAWADAGLPGAIYTDDMAYRSGPMLNPKMMRELYTDSFQRITDTAHSLGMKIVVHSCGNVIPLLEWFAECGFDGVHALEPTAGVTLEKAKELVGDRMCLLGNIDITHILVDADKEEVFEAVRASIQAAGKGGGYIVAPTNSHQAMTLDRIRWMLEAVETYGRYPLEGGAS
jgi:uroporphyrinogen decarboxylase